MKHNDVPHLQKQKIHCNTVLHQVIVINWIPVPESANHSYYFETNLTDFALLSMHLSGEQITTDRRKATDSLHGSQAFIWRELKQAVSLLNVNIISLVIHVQLSLPHWMLR